ncbi:MAG TPA: bifunctional D-glycero-beta-D-manno-heptose-7-phosphate kinase/D-glycero-beta-D-manno-heptose 1-phosphate adenylyltransferase HldE [Terriglobales bacterium]|nr:bifunctional D-glycero-beta-D-manno-heptose-7-phosphate kinase/D-glycero-beta-D-manno-heptose 1-phosphate adenylyltransferase HldE [Terriglobales bacterium]
MISPELAALVESGWRNPRIPVLGDVMLDQYVWGEVERISPEAPVPIIRATMRDERPGGAANVAMNLAQLGANVTLLGFAGGDPEQERLEALLAAQGIEPRLTAIPGVPTTTKLRILSGHQQMMRLDTENRAARPATEYEALLKTAIAALPNAAAIVLSDYAKGAVSETVCRTVIREAARRHIPVLVDPKQQSFSRYRGATAICPNLKELAAATGEMSGDVDAVLAAGQALASSLELEFIAATLGDKGITVLRPGSRFHAPAIAQQVFDVSGAGDTVAAVLALVMACGVPVEAGVELANVAAGVVVGKVGTAPIRREELMGALSQAVAREMDDKVLPLDRLIAQVAAWRRAGQQIVFTNGCFDILHIGHIRLLEKARRLGDRLIVGLNSDDSVRRLKGGSRPIVSEPERARVLAALGSVDAVVTFAEDTPLGLIEALRPDVLVKGGDYVEDQVVGAREVRAWGGRVHLVPLVPETSTSRLIRKSISQSQLTAKVLSA